ncbi:MAG: hypothetical protein N2999_01695 [Proteobacteria bacterium]|nr:hypothetical protein [Pseudomonadota bacterium]
MKISSNKGKGLINFLFITMLLTALYGCATKEKQAIVKIDKEITKPVITEEKNLIEIIREKKTNGKYKDIIELYEKRKDEFVSIELLKPVVLSLLSEKRFDDILKIGEEKLSKIPNLEDKEINLILGIAYYEKSVFEASRRILTSLYDSGYKNDLLNIYLALLYQKRNQSALALSIIGEIEDYEKKNYLQGKILFTEGSYERAIERFRVVKEYADAKIYTLYCLFYLNRYDELLKYYEENRLQLNEKTIPVISLVFINRGDIKKALELLESVPLTERKGSFYRNLGLIYDLYLDDREKAKNYYEKYLKEVKDEEVIKWLNN